MLAVGLMSGTSLDGIDAALVSIVPREQSYAIDLLAFETYPFESELDLELRAALPPRTPTASQLAYLDRRLGEAFAHAAKAIAGKHPVAYVSSHGQTIYHEGSVHVTMQLGDPYLIRDASDASVVFDFRRADCAVNGEGAPLVPYVDAILLADKRENRVALNLGGIANITVLPRETVAEDVVAFDCGPGVMLIDAFVRMRSRGRSTMDVDGKMAQRGAIDAKVLRELLADPYFSKAPPKSTGRERFGTQFLAAHANALDEMKLEDAVATLTELTAKSVADAIDAYAKGTARVLCSGGGARNPALMERLRNHLPEAALETTDSYGIPADAKEAIAFAVLGYETLRERVANVPRVTGATRPTVLGAIVPKNLRALMGEVETECQSL